MTSRRDFIAGSAALACSTAVPASSAYSVQGRLLTIRGTRLWVEVDGAPGAPTLLYLHGGPGVGSYDFSAYAAPLLRRDWRLVVFDQRGVLRSDPLSDRGAYTLDDLIADTEALRALLGIQRWSVLGHSFGGHYGLRYALAHSDRVERLYLENAGFSFPESSRSSLQAAADLYRRLGRVSDAARCDAAVGSSASGAEMLSAGHALLDGLGDHRQDLYIYDPVNRGFFGRLQARSGLFDARWEQGRRQAELLFGEGRILEPMLDQLPAWSGPTIMLKGETDHVASAPELQAVVTRRNGMVLAVERSGHFSHVEQPALLAQRIVEGRRAAR